MVKRLYDNLIENLSKISKTKLLVGFIVISMITTVTLTNFLTIGYAVKIDDKVIGTTKVKNEAVKAINEVKTLAVTSNAEDIETSKINDVTIEMAVVTKSNIDEKEELKINIAKEAKIVKSAYSIHANDKTIVSLDDKKEAEEIFEKLKDNYSKNEENENIKSVEFLEEVEIKKEDVETFNIMDSEDAYNLIVTGVKETKKYEVVKGDTASQIAQDHDMFMKDMEKANPEVNLDRLKIGQALNLTIPKPLISVKVIKEVEYEEKIPYKTTYENTSSLYKGQSSVKVKGKNGLKKVTAEYELINGYRENVNILYEEVLKNPVTKVVRKGTKERPKTLAYGKFYWPTNGRISSYFGYRRNPFGSGTQFHPGIDIANRTGTSVRAADGGKVIFSGYNGSKGKCIIINHENGYTSVYAHNSSLLVSVGQRVYRGQTIARMGSTGMSTGPHLHFEIRKYGVAKNPLSYLN